MSAAQKKIREITAVIWSLLEDLLDVRHEKISTARPLQNTAAVREVGSVVFLLLTKSYFFQEKVETLARESLVDSDYEFSSVMFQVSEEDFRADENSDGGQQNTIELFGGVVAFPLLCKSFGVDPDYSWILEKTLFERLIYLVFDVSEYFRVASMSEEENLVNFLVEYEGIPTQIVVSKSDVGIYIHKDSDAGTFEIIRKMALNLERALNVFCFSQDVMSSRHQAPLMEKAEERGGIEHQLDQLIKLNTLCLERLDRVEKRLGELEKRK